MSAYVSKVVYCELQWTKLCGSGILYFMSTHTVLQSLVLVTGIRQKPPPPWYFLSMWVIGQILSHNKPHLPAFLQLYSQKVYKLPLS